MTQPIHIVKQGETLGKLARQFGCAVSELRELNPFITNPNYIRAGWKLQIPVEHPSSGAERSAAEVKNEPEPVLYLDPIAEDPQHGQINFCGKNACSGEFHFTDIIYEVGHESFWLLREHTLDSIVRAADKLRTALVSNDPDSRLKALDDRGLLDHFLEPKLSSFLDAEKSQRLLEIEHEMTAFKSSADAILALEPDETPRGLGLTPNLPAQQQQELSRNKSAYLARGSERFALQTEAREQASKEGYRFERGELFSPEAIEMQAIVQTYLKQQKKLLAQETPEFNAQEVDEFRKFHSRLLQDLSADVFAPGQEIAEWVRENKSLHHYSEFTRTLIRAAAYGLALPEFALHKPDEDIAWGIKRYREYHQLLRQKADLGKSIQSSFDNWLKVGKQMPPGNLFTAERAQWLKWQQNEKSLKDQAEYNVLNSKPALHLLWEPENFTPKPEQRLVRSNFPLREISVPTERAKLSHLSFTDLRHALGKQAAKNLKDDLAKVAEAARKTRPDINAGDLSDDKALDYWLESMGAKKLVIQESWFDASGFFVPGHFNSWLQQQGYLIDNLRDKAAFDAWGKDLRQIIFRKNPYGPLRLFDISPQARLIRCLTPPKGNLHSGVAAKGFQFSLSKGASSSAEAFLDVNLARGEVDLVSFELPKRAEALPVKVTYENHKGQIADIDLGRFCFEGSIKAWGFAGASMLMSSALALKPSDSKNNLSLDTRRDAEQGIRRLDIYGIPNVRADEAISANLNLFAGAQAGIKISGSLQWAPPKDLITARSIMPSNELDPSKKDWLAVATFGANLSAALGVGGKAGFSLSLLDGQVILRLKAAIIAGPGVEGEFSFTLGYQAMVHFLDILNRELIKNEYHKLNWIQPEVFEYFTKAQVLHAVGVDLQWVFLLGYNKVNRLYEAMTAGQRAGLMAYQIKKNKNNAELRQWFALLTPEGLAGLLGTLLESPREFEVLDGAVSKNNKISLGALESHLLQQYAIEEIMSSIVESAQRRVFGKYGCADSLGAARWGFRKSVSQIGAVGFSEYNEKAFQLHMGKLDKFMSLELGGGGAGNHQKMRARYTEWRDFLIAGKNDEFRFYRENYVKDFGE